jgi:uncharacterized protein (DUF433 family)
METIPAHIELTPDVGGGKPRVAGRRITVQDVVIWHERLNQSADEIANEHGLSLAEIYAALSYYYDHREDVDRSIREDEDFISKLRAGARSRLKAKLGGS